MGGLGAWRKFEPDRFTDEEVEQFKTEWRAAHPAIKRFWYDIDRAAGPQYVSAAVSFAAVASLSNVPAHSCLKLPSGRKLAYPQPRIIGDEREQRVVFADNAAGQFNDCRHGHGAYGGLWTENVVSGIARDLLAEAMLRSKPPAIRSSCMCTMRSCAEVPDRLRQHRRIHPIDDAQTGLGARAADRSERLDRPALLQMRR